MDKTQSYLPYLSVVIPAYNEQHRIADTLYGIKDYLSLQGYSSEIIVVDDGSHDMTTELVKFVDIYGSEMKGQNTGILIENIKNVGKGFSIARGMIKAKGEVVMFCDADMATPIAELEKLLPYFEEGYDMVVGSRKMQDSKVEGRSLVRSLISVSLSSFVRFMSITGIRDTQCGFKAYTRDAAQNIALLQKVYGFGFDVEHLYIAYKLGLNVKEVGVEWVDQPGSTVRPIRDSLGVLFELLKIRVLHWNLSITAKE